MNHYHVTANYVTARGYRRVATVAVHAKSVPVAHERARESFARTLGEDDEIQSLVAMLAPSDVAPMAPVSDKRDKHGFPTHPIACRNRAHRPAWRVEVRRANYSAFNGYRRTPSAYSQLRCGECGAVWRTKAAYVDETPDAT
jgi:hypothetical protein